MSKQAYVYILANKWNTVLYVGVTTDLAQRVYKHRHKVADGFTSKYNVTKLVYYEIVDGISSAIAREKQLKSGSRQRKRRLVETLNPNWDDLSNKL